jgi:multiple sugar transport system substrate-binding protein
MTPALQTLYTWGDHWYGSRNDGDAQILYFRKDILEDPTWQQKFQDEVGHPMPYPIKTWQDLYEITNFFNGKDWNGDGDPDDGISLHLKVGGQGMFHYETLAAPFAITPNPGADPRAVDQYHNVFWFDPTNMDPLINKPGQVMALDFLRQLAATGQVAQFGWDLGQAWDDFFAGNSIATFSWGDVGTIAENPDRSTITGHLGAATIPCSSTWYDLETQQTVTDTANPNCVGNTTGGSWHPVMSAFAHNPDLAYFLQSMIATQPINFFDVTTGWMGVDPSSKSSLFPPEGTASVDDYVAMNYNADDALQYITAYGDQMFNKPIYETYLRIPGTTEFQTDLDIRLSEAMVGTHTAQEALDLVAQAWTQAVDDYGREDLLKIYQDSIGYTPSS